MYAKVLLKRLFAYTFELVRSAVSPQEFGFKHILFCHFLRCQSTSQLIFAISHSKCQMEMVTNSICHRNSHINPNICSTLHNNFSETAEKLVMFINISGADTRLQQSILPEHIPRIAASSGGLVGCLFQTAAQLCRQESPQMRQCHFATRFAHSVASASND